MRGGPRGLRWRWDHLWLGAPILGLVLAPGALGAAVGSRTSTSVSVSKRLATTPSATLGHTVRSGDNLWTISRRYGVSIEALTHANRLQPKQRLRIGQHLMIPGSAVQKGRQEPPSLAEIVLSSPPEPRIQLMWPVGGPVASAFGPRGNSWHGGIDIHVERGTPIRAAAPGMVISSGTERAYGQVVKIWHADDLMTVYAHNQENAVKVGDWVERGQVIGIVGRTGRATAPHLHFEVRLDGKKYNPLFWLPPPGTVDVVTNTQTRGSTPTQ